MYARSDFIADNNPIEEEYTYIQLYDHTTTNLITLRIKEEDSDQLIDIIDKVQEDDNYGIDMFFEALAKGNLNYERVIPQRVYF